MFGEEGSYLCVQDRKQMGDVWRTPLNLQRLCLLTAKPSLVVETSDIVGRHPPAPSTFLSLLPACPTTCAGWCVHCERVQTRLR